MAMRIAMIPMTTSSSMSVKPFVFRCDMAASLHLSRGGDCSAMGPGAAAAGSQKAEQRCRQSDGRFGHGRDIGERRADADLVDLERRRSTGRYGELRDDAVVRCRIANQFVRFRLRTNRVRGQIAPIRFEED